MIEAKIEDGHVKCRCRGKLNDSLSYILYLEELLGVTG